MVTVTQSKNNDRKKKNADGETRTRKDYATRTSSVRVYQFRHIRTSWLLKTSFF